MRLLCHRRIVAPINAFPILHGRLTGMPRAPAAAFEPRTKDEALSVSVESSLAAAGLPLTWSVETRQYAARITVGDCLAVDLEAFHTPIPESPPQPANPHHGEIRGLVEMRLNDPDTYETTITALAKASTIVFGTV
jgi:hypothetical protein